MAISKLNSLFSRHGRILFGVFTIIIIVTFVDFLAPGGNDIFSGFSLGSGNVGSVFGKSVSDSEFHDEYRRLSIQCFMSGYDMPQQEDAYQMVMFNIAVDHYAQSLGLTVSDEAIAKVIAAIPIFQKDGNFSMDLYQAFLTNNHFSAAEIDNVIGAMLLRQSLVSEINSLVLNVPKEYNFFAMYQNSECEVASATFKRDDFRKEIEVTEADLEEYFQGARKLAETTGTSRYMVPAVYEAQIVTFPANGDQDGAMANARRFADIAFNRISETITNQNEMFNTLLQEEKLTAVPTGEFADNTTKIGPIEDPAIIAELLAINTEIPVSNAIAIADGAVVVYFNRIVPAVSAENLDNPFVRDEVLRDVFNFKADELAKAAAEKAYSELNAMTTAERKAAIEAGKYGFGQAKTVKQDVLMNPLTQLDVLAVELPVNGITNPVPALDGYSIAFLKNRTTPEITAEMQQKSEMFYKYLKQNAAATGFQSYIAANCLFENRGE